MERKDLNQSIKMTWEEFLKFEECNEGNYEFNGVEPIKLMSVSVDHQRVVQRIYKKLDGFLDGSKCETLLGPTALVYDAYYSSTGTKQKEPDLMVICDNNIQNGKYCGIPLLIIEVVSPGNYESDYKEKKDLYERLGVAEYWIVNHYIGEIKLYNLDVDSRQYKPESTYRIGDIASSKIFQEFNITVGEIFTGLDIKEEDLAKFKAKIIPFKIR